MDKLTMMRLLAILDREQSVDSAGLAITAERYLAVADEAAMTPQEAQIVLASPLARDLLALADSFHTGTQRSSEPEIGTTYAVSPTRLAAATTDDRSNDLDIEIGEPGRPVARLTSRPGPGGVFRHLLRLHLVPGAWLGGVVEGLQVTLREGGPQGRVWITGITDNDGAIRAGWPYVDGSPLERLSMLPDRRLRLDLE